MTTDEFTFNSGHDGYTLFYRGKILAAKYGQARIGRIPDAERALMARSQEAVASACIARICGGYATADEAAAIKRINAEALV